MRFDVQWQQTALRELAAIWNVAADRADISAASDELDRLLEQRANTLGESREENFRVLLLPPLGIEFQVLAKKRRVLVIRV